MNTWIVSIKAEEQFYVGHESSHFEEEIGSSRIQESSKFFKV